jgi:predicted nucleic acid-binding protein
LIGLERIGRLDILPALYGPIVIPPEVLREFGTPLPWLIVNVPTDPAFVTALKMLVDDGEAEAIALAHAQGRRIILDDRRARAVARGLGLAIIGTVGMLVQAKRLGIITSLGTLLDALEAHEFYISEALKAEALRLAHESV